MMTTAKSNSIRVFVADDHAIVRDGLRRLIEETPDLTFDGSCDDGIGVVRRLPDAQWHVLVLDLSLPNRGGVEVLRQVREQRPDIAVVILSAYPEEQYATRMLKAGASAYVTKGQPTDELVAAIRAVANGEQHLTKRQSDWTESSKGTSVPHELLSGREHQIFLLLVNGRSPTDISAELNLSPSTVSTHIAHIKTKLKVTTLSEIIQYAFRVGLVS